MKYQTILLAGILILISFLTYRQLVKKKNTTTSAPTILFICKHGAARSTIAAAYFNKIAKEKDLNYRAVFRGISPDSIISPSTEKGLINDHFDIHGWEPVAVSKNDIENAYKIVTLDCELTGKDSIDHSITQWSDIPMSQGYNQARDVITIKLQEFIAPLIKEKKQ